MPTSKPPESDRPKSRPTVSGAADDWIRQFSKHLALHLSDQSRTLPQDAGVAESQIATARAIVATFIDSGMDWESILELIGKAAIECRGQSASVAWDDALNQRRFELIDKEIQQTLTLAESVELAGLTRLMRDHLESETNLPMKGAQALHRKLIQPKSTGDFD